MLFMVTGTNFETASFYTAMLVAEDEYAQGNMTAKVISVDTDNVIPVIEYDPRKELEASDNF